jgi:hypothetical protein
VTWELALESVTERPPDGAALLSVTTHVLEPPAVTVAGLQLRSERADCDVTASENVTEARLRLAVRIAEMVPLAWPAVALKFALVDPDGTTTDAGTVTEELPLPRSTVAPPEGAAPVRDTVQMLEAPGATVPGVHVKAASAAVWVVGSMVRIVDCLAPPEVAEMVDV